MKQTKLLLIILFVLIAGTSLPALDLGALSFSMFIPLKGYISELGFPLALRNIDISFFLFLGISTSLVVYNIQGLGVTGLATTDPIVGPSYTLLGNLCLKLVLPIDFLHITAKGGGFAFYSVSSNLIEGNLNRAIADDNGWDTASANMSYENTIGFGYLFGGSVTFYVVEEMAGIFVEVLYYDGEAPLQLSGKVTATDGGAVAADDAPIKYPNAKIDFSGIEITLGITVTL